MSAPPAQTAFGAIALSRSSFLFTSESVSEGHPDKVADRISDTIVDLFLSKDPEARVAVLSSDLFGSARALKAQIEAIAAGGADIVIGTQIVAKGHNFPLLTLVGVIDADLGLQGSDLRAAERTFQLMRQVAGRAGRAERPGRALLQTHQPEHPVIRAILSGDEEEFWRAEAAGRRAEGVPLPEDFADRQMAFAGTPFQQRQLGWGELLTKMLNLREFTPANTIGEPKWPLG